MSLRHSLLGFPRFIFVGEYKINGNNYDDDDKKKLIRQEVDSISKKLRGVGNSIFEIGNNRCH